MVNRVLQPQEIEVFYVIPALRRELALYMKQGGKSQREIAGLLGVTEPAVSQYMTSKRAAMIRFSDAVKLAIKASAQRITNPASMMREMQRLLTLTRDERVVCRVHESLGSAPLGCNVCFENKHEEVIQIKGPVQTD